MTRATVITAKNFYFLVFVSSFFSSSSFLLQQSICLSKLQWRKKTMCVSALCAFALIVRSTDAQRGRHKKCKKRYCKKYYFFPIHADVVILLYVCVSKRISGERERDRNLLHIRYVFVCFDVFIHLFCCWCFIIIIVNVIFSIARNTHTHKHSAQAHSVIACVKTEDKKVLNRNKTSSTEKKSQYETADASHSMCIQFVSFNLFFLYISVARVFFQFFFPHLIREWL